MRECSLAISPLLRPTNAIIRFAGEGGVLNMVLQSGSAVVERQYLRDDGFEVSLTGMAKISVLAADKLWLQGLPALAKEWICFEAGLRGSRMAITPSRKGELFRHVTFDCAPIDDFFISGEVSIQDLESFGSCLEQISDHFGGQL